MKIIIYNFFTTFRFMMKIMISLVGLVLSYNFKNLGFYMYFLIILFIFFLIKAMFNYKKLEYIEEI
jgi:uncharacterized membrane protein YdbT with pleckstrin-like domain